MPPIHAVIRLARPSNQPARGFIFRPRLILLATALLAALLAILISHPKAEAVAPSFAAKQDFATGSTPISVAAGDLNGDGKPDVVIANNGANTVSVLLNTTAPGAITANFATKQDFATGTGPRSVAVGELNGDGMLDLVVANQTSNNVSVLLNTTAPGAATPSFAAKQDFATATGPYFVAVGDLSGDGQLDLVTANLGSNTASVLLNTTAPGAVTPSFGAKQDFATGFLPTFVALGDLNGDGRPDLVVGGDATGSVLLNTTAPGAATPSFAAKQDFAAGTKPLSIALGDLNGDGKLDLAVTNTDASTVSVMRNTTGLGATTLSFAARQVFATANLPGSVTAGDFNGDGRLDLVVANEGSNTTSMLVNATSPGATTLSFAPKQDFGTGNAPRSVAKGDLNGDGKLDLTFANNSSDNVSVLLNTTDIGPATPSFTAKQDFATSVGARGVSVGDVNGDGKLDLAVVTLFQNKVSVLLNTTSAGANTASFAGKQDFDTGGSPFFVTLADLNSDGRLDLTVANAGDNNLSVLRSTTSPGDTTASFAAKQDFATGMFPMSVSVGDLNGDGKLDLAVAEQGNSNVSVFLNTTAPGATTLNFAAKQDFAVGILPTSVTAGDLNGDGRLDLAVANADSSSLVSVLLNTTAPGAATPSFAAKQDFGTGLRPISVAMGDLNGDGKLDLALANMDADTVSILINTAAPGASTPSFVAKQDFAAGSAPRSVTLGDLNGDGKLDLAVANQNGDNVSVLVNTTAPGDATPSFSAKRDFSVGTGPGSIARGDFNNDGKLEFAAANTGGNNVSVLLNTPTIVAATGVSRAAGSAATNSQIATVTNYGGNGGLTVSVSSTNPANLVAISNIVNSNGIVTADIFAGCAASNATFTLQATDGSSTVTGTFTVTVTANTAPTLTYSTPQSVAFNGSLNVSPTSATDNGSIASYAVQSVVPALTTAPTVNASGVVSITNAQPAGSHDITIRATDNCGITTDAAFTLNVSKGNQTITVGTHAPANASYNTSFTVAATSSSGLPVSYSSAGVCTNAGATFTMTSATGTCTVRYDQLDDTNYNAAPQVTESVTAQKASTSTAVTSSLNPSLLGQNVIFTATVTSTAGTPTGAVQFKIDGVNIGFPAPLSGSGVAQLGTSSLSAGTHTVAADYSGDTNFAASTGTLAGGQVVTNRPLISLTPSSYNVSESAGFVTINVTRSGDTAPAVSVDYSTSFDNGVPCSTANGVATPKCDFTAAAGKLNFAAGETNKTIIIPLTQDSFVEGPETFSLSLANPSAGAGVATPSTASITIADDATEPATNPIDDASNFVRQHYHDFLNREPDETGWLFWINQITSCGTDVRCNEVKRIDVSASFFLSIEFQQTGYLVERIYKVGYGDGTGISTFGGRHQLSVPIVRVNEFFTDTQRIGRGVVVLAPGWEQLLESNKQAYALEFVQTSRFVTAFPTTMTPAQFVNQLNQNAGNVLSPTEIVTAINLFGGAPNSSNLTARAQAVRQVAEDNDLYNAEFNRAFVLAQYFGYLRRNPSDSPESTLDHTGYDFWLTKLNQFNGNYINAEMVKAFLSSIEYRNRFGP